MNTAAFLNVLGTSLVLLTTSAVASAQPCAPVHTAVEQGLKLVQDTAVQSKQTVAYRDGPHARLYVNCPSGKVDIAVSWAGPTPDAKFYKLVGQAGNLVSRQPATDVVKAAKQCRQQALQDDFEIASVEQGSLAIECQAYTRDGGGTSFSIFPL